MIPLQCKCGHAFELGDETAGSFIQCPDCGLLNDIPTLQELADLSEDGVFQFGAAPAHGDMSLADLQEIFSSKKRTGDGGEKDFRSDSLRRRSKAAEQPQPTRVVPKYDPLTGELIRALELKEEAPKPVLPVETLDTDEPIAVIPIDTPMIPPQRLTYSEKGTRGTSAGPGPILLELFMAANAFVMFLVFILYVLAHGMSTILTVESPLVLTQVHSRIALQLLNFPLYIILAHYGCVIEEMGPEDRDELPRPLRHLDPVEDIISPLFRVLLALVLSFALAWCSTLPGIPLGDARIPLFCFLVLIGLAIFPAIVLTTTTSGTIINLRPDRVLSVMLANPGRYVLAVITLIVAAIPSMFYIVIPAISSMGSAAFTLAAASRPTVAFPVLFACVYLTHFFCWQLGLLYRANHEDFDWLLQRHSSSRGDRIAPPKMYVPKRQSGPRGR